jgi:hypothetical protein
VIAIHTALAVTVRTVHYAMAIPRLATSGFQLIFVKKKSSCFEMSALLIWLHMWIISSCSLRRELMIEG